MKRIEIPVTAYVSAYLRRRYCSSGVFDVRGGRDDLSMALMGISDLLMLNPESESSTSPTLSTVVLIVDDRLANVADMYREFLRYGAFFQYQFYKDLVDYVSSQRDLAREQHLSRKEWNERKAVQAFKKKYNLPISEETLVRQYTRKVGWKRSFAFKEVKGRFGFNEGDGQVRGKAARLVNGLEIYIRFCAYSRAKGRVVERKWRVPSFLCNQPGDDWLVWAEARIDVLNKFLIKGFSIK